MFLWKGVSSHALGDFVLSFVFYSTDTKINLFADLYLKCKNWRRKIIITPIDYKNKIVAPVQLL